MINLNRINGQKKEDHLLSSFHQPGVGAVPICTGCGTVALPGRWGLAVAGWDVPLHCVRVWANLKCVEVVQVAWDVVLWILAVVCQATKEKHLERKEGSRQRRGGRVNLNTDHQFKTTLFPMRVKLWPSLGQGCGPFRGGFGFNFFHSHLKEKADIRYIGYHR